MDGWNKPAMTEKRSGLSQNADQITRQERAFGPYSISCESRIGVGKCVIAGRVPAIHAAPPQILAAQTSVSSEADEETAVFSWMAGSSPAMTETESWRHPGLTLKTSAFPLNK